jgi:O-succinylhomoserine sulfhydrylase
VVIDIAAVAELAHGAGARLIVDNVFATPMLQRPLELGADIVVYSATKHIDGQGRALGGAVLADKAFIDERLMPLMRHTGPSMSPLNAWILLKGLETLDLRVERHCANATRVAQFLEGHAKTLRVLYPGLASHPQHDLVQRQMTGPGTIVSFEVPDGREGAFRALNALELILISNNLGDAKSLVTHPATTTHQRMTPEERAQVGVTDGMIRLSVGLEDAEDLCDDLGQALAVL